tara:strand:+ start:39 stop:290 length:252 start_codon:yes stop_codon:yes gene_type:complete
MDDFNLKKYLAEGKLEERIFRDGKMYQNQEDYKTQMSLEYERGVVKKEVQQTLEDMESNKKLLTRDYIDEIISTLEDLKISDF